MRQSSHFIFVTEDFASAFDAADIALNGEREYGVTSVEDAVREAAEAYLVGRYDIEKIRVWVLAPDKSITFYTVTTEITYNIDRD